MKRITVVLALCVFAISGIAQENVKLNINAGIHNSSNSFYLEGNVKKTVFNEIFMGLGLVYSNIDIKATYNLFTYDRKTFSPFLILGYSLNTKNKISFLPQLKAGYSFYTYSLNEFKVGEEKDNGFLLAPGIEINYNLNDKLDIGLHTFYNRIFNSYKNDYGISIPANYVIVGKKYIYDFSFGAGITYKF